jgi:hypothetical protein
VTPGTLRPLRRRKRDAPTSCRGAMGSSAREHLLSSSSRWRDCVVCRSQPAEQARPAAFLAMIAPFLKQGSASNAIQTISAGRNRQELEEENNLSDHCHWKPKERHQSHAPRPRRREQPLRNARLSRTRSSSSCPHESSRAISHRIIRSRSIEVGELIEPDTPVLTEEGLAGKTTVVPEHAAVVVSPPMKLPPESHREGTRNKDCGERSSHTGSRSSFESFWSWRQLPPGRKSRHPEWWRFPRRAYRRGQRVLARELTDTRQLCWPLSSTTIRPIVVVRHRNDFFRAPVTMFFSLVAQHFIGPRSVLGARVLRMPTSRLWRTSLPHWGMPWPSPED